MSKLLLVEDNEIMLSLLETLLKMEGYQVLIHNGHGEENLFETLDQEKPDLIILDVNLSQQNGIHVLRRIRQQDQDRQPKILMTSGMDVKTQCILEGADGFLLKPFMPNDLVKCVRALLTA